jgi:hypothetical protein
MTVITYRCVCLYFVSGLVVAKSEQVVPSAVPQSIIVH